MVPFEKWMVVSYRLYTVTIARINKDVGHFAENLQRKEQTDVSQILTRSGRDKVHCCDLETNVSRLESTREFILLRSRSWSRELSGKASFAT